MKSLLVWTLSALVVWGAESSVSPAPDFFLDNNYNCSYVTSSVSNTAGGSTCGGLMWSGYSVQWTWSIKTWSTVSNSVRNTTSATVAGTGWCASLGIPCWSGVTGLTTPYNNPSYPYNSNDQVYYWTSAVTSTPPGGAYGAGVGCAAAVTTIQPMQAVVVPAIICKSIAGSPIIIDTNGSGFHLTSLQDGVQFREKRDQALIHMSWTNADYGNGWLALPHNGKVEALEDLFGNFTPQPHSTHPNGYLALAVYDLNHDGVIDADDLIYQQLRVWVDANHDGVSQPEELFTLAEMGIRSLSLNYTESRYTDAFGNQFRYKSTIADARAPQDKTTYDVFLDIAAH